MSIVRIEPARVYVATDAKGRRFRRFSKRGALSAMARRRVLDACNCELAEFEQGYCTYPGWACRFHDIATGYRERVVERLIALYVRADREGSR